MERERRLKRQRHKTRYKLKKQRHTAPRTPGGCQVVERLMIQYKATPPPLTTFTGLTLMSIYRDITRYSLTQHAHTHTQTQAFSLAAVPIPPIKLPVSLSPPLTLALALSFPLLLLSLSPCLSLSPLTPPVYLYPSLSPLTPPLSLSLSLCLSISPSRFLPT